MAGLLCGRTNFTRVLLDHAGCLDGNLAQLALSHLSFSFNLLICLLKCVLAKVLCQGCVVLFANIANYKGVFMLGVYGKRQIQVENFPKKENVRVKTVQTLFFWIKKNSWNYYR